MSMQKANKNEVRKEIAALIEKIKEQSDRIGAQREIPQDDVDVILHRIEELHRMAVVWSYLNALPLSSTEFIQAKEGLDLTTELSPSTPLGLTTELPNEKPLLDATTSVVNPELETPEPGTFSTSTEFIQTKEGLGLTTELPKEKPLLDATTSVANSELETPKHGTLLKDIRSFVGFNEKIMYVRQLFGGDASAYDSALNQFNSMNSFEEAEVLLAQLAGNYSWKKDAEAVVIFIQTINRRFS